MNSKTRVCSTNIGFVKGVYAVVAIHIAVQIEKKLIISCY